MLHDLGSVRIYEAEQLLEVHFGRGDTSTRMIVKACGAKYDGARKTWRVAVAKGKEADTISRIRGLVLDKTPDAWRRALPTIGKIVAVTHKFQINIGAAGVRIELPRGHKHEWTLKNDVEGAELDGKVWLIPADCAAGATAKQVIQDCITGDRLAFREAVDYLAEFMISGELAFEEGEVEGIGLAAGSVIAADPSFVREIDRNIPKELVKAYPLKVLAIEPSEDGRLRGKLGFLAGDQGYGWLRTRLAIAEDDRPRVLDVRHVHGKWSRRRG